MCFHLILCSGQENLSVFAWVLEEQKWDIAKLILANCETLKVPHCQLSLVLTPRLRLTTDSRSSNQEVLPSSNSE
jgi:hypothetical protein